MRIILNLRVKIFYLRIDKLYICLVFLSWCFDFYISSEKKFVSLYNRVFKIGGKFFFGGGRRG